jgi:hypothetical protein
LEASLPVESVNDAVFNSVASTAVALGWNETHMGCLAIFEYVNMSWERKWEGECQSTHKQQH